MTVQYAMVSAQSNPRRKNSLCAVPSAALLILTHIAMTDRGMARGHHHASALLTIASAPESVLAFVCW